MSDKISLLAKRIINSGLEYSTGGHIHIKPENRGKFTALKERTGHSATWFKEHGTPSQKKMAVFALNSRHWKHGDGGFLRSYDMGGPTTNPEEEKRSRISNDRYKMAYDALVRSGESEADSARLAGFLGAQSLAEAGWVDSTPSNNYGGYMSNGKKMKFDSPESFWDYHVKNLGEKWPLYKKAQTIEDYYNAINHAELGLDTPEKYRTYNKNHVGDEVYLYAPAWENTNYLGNLRSLYNKRVLPYISAVSAPASRGPVTVTNSTDGGYTIPVSEREYAHRSWDPTAGFNYAGLVYSNRNGNLSRGDENEYWKAYLGLENNVPAMNPLARTEWDDKIEAEKAASGEPLSDFYGTTPQMDQMVQVIADTLHTGNLLRNYDEIKKQHPDLAPKKVIRSLYKQGKRVMENPGKWTQIEEPRRNQLYLYEGPDPETNEQAPLGMLADFGMMWSPEEGALRVHDTYDFPRRITTFSNIPVRPREMKIRGMVKYDPRKGSVLLRDGLDRKKVAKSVAKKNDSH